MQLPWNGCCCADAAGDAAAGRIDAAKTSRWRTTPTPLERTVNPPGPRPRIPSGARPLPTRSPRRTACSPRASRTARSRRLGASPYARGTTLAEAAPHGSARRCSAALLDAERVRALPARSPTRASRTPARRRIVDGHAASRVDLAQLMQELPAVEDLLEAANDAPIIRMINALLDAGACATARPTSTSSPYERARVGALSRRRHAARRGGAAPRRCTRR